MRDMEPSPWWRTRTCHSKRFSWSLARFLVPPQWPSAAMGSLKVSMNVIWVGSELRVSREDEAEHDGTSRDRAGYERNRIAVLQPDEQHL